MLSSRLAKICVHGKHDDLFDFVTREPQLASGGDAARPTTRITSTAVASKPMSESEKRDYRRAEQFMLKHGRWPNTDDGEAGAARARLISANAVAQSSAPRHLRDTHDTYAWRRRTALQTLNRLTATTTAVPNTSKPGGSARAPRQRPRTRRRASRASPRSRQADEDPADEVTDEGQRS
jgi:hypothetical protein